METYAHKSIKHCLDMLAPFEATSTLLEVGNLSFIASWYRYIKECMMVCLICWQKGL